MHTANNKHEVCKVPPFGFATDVLLDVSDYYVILTLTILAFLGSTPGSQLG
jgi:hypothetical protein